MNTNVSFGVWLEKKRGNMTQREFAGLICTDAGTISRTERECTDVRLSTAVRICRGLGLSLADFLRDWQGMHIVSIEQGGQELGSGSLTEQDVQCWLVRILEGNSRSREMLISVLNLIVLNSGLMTTPHPPMEQLFRLADIEKLLWGFSWFTFEVAPPVHTAAQMARLVTIYQQGGLLLPSELGAYVAFLRERRGLFLKQVSQESQVPLGILSSIENGMMKHLKLCDLLRLDDYFGQNGALLALYWWEASCRQQMEHAWNTIACTALYSARVKHTLVSLLISVGRWLQVIYSPENTVWHSTIRYQLGLTTPYPLLSNTRRS